MDNRVRSSCDDLTGIIFIYYYNSTKHMTAIHSKMLGFFMLPQAVHIITTGFLIIKPRDVLIPQIYFG
jgi:hypothetical protein